MSRKRTGLVIGKDFRPPEGAPHSDWCFLTVEISESDRITFRLRRDLVSKANVGDIIAFKEPRKQNDPVTRLSRLASKPGLLPPVN